MGTPPHRSWRRPQKCPTQSDDSVAALPIADERLSVGVIPVAVDLQCHTLHGPGQIETRDEPLPIAKVELGDRTLDAGCNEKLDDFGFRQAVDLAHIGKHPSQSPYPPNVRPVLGRELLERPGCEKALGNTVVQEALILVVRDRPSCEIESRTEWLGHRDTPASDDQSLQWATGLVDRDASRGERRR